MLTAVALPVGTRPTELVERHGLKRRIHDRGGEQELQFHFQDRDPVLPVRHKGQHGLARWRCPALGDPGIALYGLDQAGHNRDRPLGGNPEPVRDCSLVGVSPWPCTTFRRRWRRGPLAP